MTQRVMQSAHSEWETCSCCDLICCFACLTCCGCSSFSLTAMQIFLYRLLTILPLLLFSFLLVLGRDQVSFCFILLWSGRDRISQSFIFFPPSPPLYSFDDEKGDQKIMFLRDDRGTKVLPISAGPNFQIFEIPTSRGERLASYYIKNPRARYSVLFCHGNASDIGAMRDHLIDFSQQLTVSVFVYDYAGLQRALSPRLHLPSSILFVCRCLFSIILVYRLGTWLCQPPQRYVGRYRSGI